MIRSVQTERNRILSGWQADNYIFGLTRGRPMRNVRHLAILLPFVLTSCAHAQVAGTAKPPAPAPVKADTTALRHRLDSIADAHHGVVGYSVIDLDNGVRLSRRGDETFSTASLIKVGILVTVCELVAKGDLSLDDPLTVLKIDQVPGSGIIQFLHNGT